MLYIPVQDSGGFSLLVRGPLKGGENPTHLRKEENFLSITDYVKPELLSLCVVCYLIGRAAKRSRAVPDKWIPLLLGGVGVSLACVWVCASAVPATLQETLMAVFTGATQGVLCAGASVYAHQLFKQYEKEE